MIRPLHPVSAVSVLVAAVAVAGGVWLASRPEPTWTDVYDASVVHVVAVQLPTGGIRQEISRARGMSSIAIPYRLQARGPARVLVTVADPDGGHAIRQEVSLERTDRPNAARFLRPADPFGRDTELLSVHFQPVASDMVTVELTPLPGSSQPWLLETEVGNTNLPEAVGSPGLSVSVLVGYGEERPAVAQLLLYLQRMTVIGPWWMSPAVFAILFVVFLALAVAALVVVSRPSGVEPASR